MKHSKNIFQAIIVFLMLVLFITGILLVFVIDVQGTNDEFLIKLGLKIVGLAFVVLSYNGLSSLGIIQYLSKL